MAETTSGGPLPGVRLLDFSSVVMAPSAAHTADFLAELAAATPTGRKTA